MAIKIEATFIAFSTLDCPDDSDLLITHVLDSSRATLAQQRINAMIKHARASRFFLRRGFLQVYRSIFAGNN